MTTTLNDLSLEQIERLALLTEEMGEALQVIGKIQRHGYQAIGPDGTHYNNLDDLLTELAHVSWAVSHWAMHEIGSEALFTISAIMKEKKKAVQSYLNFDREKPVKIEKQNSKHRG